MARPMIECPACGGSGADEGNLEWGDDPHREAPDCPRCEGTGQIEAPMDFPGEDTMKDARRQLEALGIPAICGGSEEAETTPETETRPMTERDDKERPWTRERAIQLIEDLYPADSDHEQVADTGRELLQQAKDEANDWRNEPDAVIFAYARLCQDMERRQVADAMRKHNDRFGYPIAKPSRRPELGEAPDF